MVIVDRRRYEAAMFFELRHVALARRCMTCSRLVRTVDPDMRHLCEDCYLTCNDRYAQLIF